MRKVLVSLVIFLVVGGVLLNYTVSDGSREEEVIDCRGGGEVCNRTTLQYRAINCNEWRSWKDIAELNCSYTGKGVDSVSLLSDAANYVTIPLTQETYEEKVVTSTRPQPWDLEFLPSGEPIWTTKGGKLEYSPVNDSRNRVIAAFDVPVQSEVGLMGLAVDPDYDENRYIYLHYTDQKTNMTSSYGEREVYNSKVSRFVHSDGSLRNETVLLTVNASDWHAGGRLEFGSDGKLYVSTGDASFPYRASDKSFLVGKILRINPDGSTPGSNPFNQSPVYSYGHRNPQGLAWQPGTGDLYNTEHGPWRYDEINKVKAGENYGWPLYKCGEATIHSSNNQIKDNDGILAEQYNTRPERCFENWTIAPSGATFVNDTGSPWHGDLFVAGLRGSQIYRMKFEDGEFSGEEVFYTSWNSSKISLRLRDVEYRDGSLYVIGDRFGMVRLTP